MTEETQRRLDKLHYDISDILFDLVDENETLEGQVNELREQVARLTENKGEWIAQDIHNCHTNFKCSECGYIHSFMHLYGEPTADYTYCPNCGAKMKGGE